MKDPVKFWEEIINSFNDQEKCNFCWNFYAPLTEVDLNLVDTKNDCCVHVFFVWNRGGNDFSVAPNWNANFGIYENPSETFNYNVYFLIKSPVGINNYNEKSGHLVSESRYNTIFKPLRDCINFSIFNDLCLDFGVTEFSGRNIYDYQDEMYFGINLSISTQTRV